MSGLTLVALIIAPVVLLALWAVAMYNRLIVLSRRRDEAWSGVQVQLKRRHDLLPNLVAVVKGYAAHESRVLEEVTKIRSAMFLGDPREVGASEQVFSQSLVRLLAVAERYPNLKADRNFRDLQNTLVRIEDDIQMSRRYYNGTVRNYNMAVETFPSMLVAQSFSFKESPFFELEAPAEADTPTVSFSHND